MHRLLRKEMEDRAHELCGLHVSPETGCTLNVDLSKWMACSKEEREDASETVIEIGRRLGGDVEWTRLALQEAQNKARIADLEAAMRAQALKERD